MATRPLDLSPERASWGETETKKEKVEREKTKKQRDQGREKGKRERWERVLSWCDFWGTCLGGAAIIYAACKFALLWGWRLRLTEIEEEEKRIKIPGQIQRKAHRSVVNVPLCTSAPATANPPYNQSGQTRSLSKDVRSTSSLPWRGRLLRSGHPTCDLSFARDGAREATSSSSHLWGTHGLSSQTHSQ